MAANKEAVVILLDVGPGMNDGEEDGPTSLQQAKACIGMVLQRRIFSESKDEFALVLLGTEETANNLADTESGEYCHITVAQNLKQADWKLLQFVQDIEVSMVSADFVDGIIIGMDVLMHQTQGQKFAGQRLLLFSNFSSEYSPDQVDVIINGIKKTGMEVNVIGPTSLGHGNKEDEVGHEDRNHLRNQKPKTAQQLSGEALLQRILDETNGEAYSFSEALPALTNYQKKNVQSAGWNSPLEIARNLRIPITGYIKASEFKLKPWKTACAQRPEVKVLRETTYHMNDEVQTEVLKQDTVLAYRYGTTLVPFSEEDKVNMEYKTGDKGLKVLGFTKQDYVRQHWFLGDKTMYIVGKKDHESAQVVLSAFIRALYETNMVAVVRYAYSARSSPRIGFLSPRIKPSYECLVFIQLPFMEDLRRFIFAPFDLNKKHVPTVDQLKTVDELIDSMDLTTASVGEDGAREEALKAQEVVNPYIQRLYQCMQHRVFHPEEPIPEIPERLKAALEPPEEIINLAAPVLEKIRGLFPLEKLITKKSVETGADIFQNGDKAGGDEPEKKKTKVDEELEGGLAQQMEDLVSKVGSITPAEDFKNLVALPHTQFSNICKQLGSVILQLVTDPLANTLYHKTLSCLKVYREESVKKNYAELFNTFLQNLKSSLRAKDKELWDRIVTARKNVHQVKYPLTNKLTSLQLRRIH
ncbi:X-ray repair cross-complementing protein 5-like isoform X2 [Tachypleus tridentatus]|uniref:X-ray repair cross-complementing protein 5-like isoform X2 n=1 Tax=Tachypleus tridentatus TaxID=6853 RepID=UPI003FD4A665